MYRRSINYPTIFEVSKAGSVKSVRTGKIFSQYLHENGYYIISTKIGGRQGVNCCVKVHRLIAEVYCENPDNKPFVNHINGIKTDNRSCNLEWCTHEENMAHASRTGLIENGAKKLRKVSDEDLLHLFSMYKPYDKTKGMKYLELVTGLHRTNICRNFKRLGLM